MTIIWIIILALVIYGIVGLLTSKKRAIFEKELAMKRGKELTVTTEQLTIILLSEMLVKSTSIENNDDVVELTSDIARRIVKLFAKNNVNQQRELLIAYENFKLMTTDKFNCAEHAIDRYLANNSD